MRAQHPVRIAVDYSTGVSIGGAELHLGWELPNPEAIQQAVAVAKRAQVAVVFANDRTGEGMDRSSLALQGDQDRLIAAVAKANRRTIVVLHTAGPVLVPWRDKVAAIVEAWYPGQMSGRAIAQTLFGDVDPSGRLPVTWPASPRQGPTASARAFPGINDTVPYAEGIFVGYRYYDHFQQSPLYPFGYGLSYTTFTLSHLHVRAVPGGGYRVTVDVRNTGRRLGAEVVELYVGFPAAAGEPPRQLKAFAKLSLAPSRHRTVTLTLPRSSFTYFRQSQGRFVIAPGRYRIEVGTSSRDLPLTTQIAVR